jgi:hypothetical protein
MVVSLTVVDGMTLPEMTTISLPMNPVPVIVIGVSPVIGPRSGSTEVTVGLGGGWKASGGGIASGAAFASAGPLSAAVDVEPHAASARAGKARTRQDHFIIEIPLCEREPSHDMRVTL